MDEELQVEVLRLEDERSKHPESLPNLIKLAHLTRSSEVLQDCLQVYQKRILETGYTELSNDGALILEIAFDHWKSGFGSALNYSHERREFLTSLIALISRVETIDQLHLSHRFSYFASLIHESYGSFSKALIYLSELISLQVKTAGVSLAALILRAATLLIILNRIDEAIEYLEYLDDDDIIRDSKQRLLIVSLLHVTYRQSNRHEWLLPQVEERLFKLHGKVFKGDPPSSPTTVYLSVSEVFLPLCSFSSCLVLLREVQMYVPFFK